MASPARKLRSFISLKSLMWTGLCGLAVCIAPLGCASSGKSPSVSASASGEGAPVSTAEPIGLQIIHVEPDLKGQRFSDLLNFETKSDTVFIATSGGLRATADSSIKHTGQRSLRLSGSGKMSVKLSALLGSRDFPDEWTLAGGYFYCDKPARVAVVAQSGSRTILRNTVSLSPGKWSPVMLDLSALADSQQKLDEVPTLLFSIDNPDRATVWCDDVILIDNTQWIVGGPDQTPGPNQWIICRRGFNYICDVPTKFTMKLLSAELNEKGWRLEEANQMRARFSSTGKDKAITIFPDGRSYWDGNYRPLAANLRSQPLWAQQQDSPAQIQVPDTMGRINRRSPGDENNDGYNETRAAYEIIAAGPRLELTIVPRSVAVLEPMLEITGLAAGQAIVTLEGRLVERTLRLEDGTLLVEIPAEISRPTNVNVHIK